MKAPTLSILLTYHNEGPLLTETLASLVAGTRQPGEVLIYDDASTRLPEAYIPDGLPVRVVNRMWDPASDAIVCWRSLQVTTFTSMTVMTGFIPSGVRS